MDKLVLLPFSIFEKLRDLLRDGVRHKVNRKAAEVQIEILQNRLEGINETLSHRKKQIAQFHNIKQATKNDWDFEYDQCKKHITSIGKHLDDIVISLKSRRTRMFPTTMDGLLQITKDEFDLVNGSLEALNRIMSSLHGGFIVVTDMVPRNPPRILLNFDDPSSPETRLKNAIFDKKTETTTVCAVANGMGGVGKTCALRAIGNHKEAGDRFPDGVLYMLLGSAATKTDLIHGLANFVKCSGGEKEGVELEHEKLLNNAIRRAAKWFQGRVCLFLIDDIWCETDIPRAVTQMLMDIVSHKDARMAFTTRYHTIECDIRVPFETRGISDAKEILMHAADLRSQELSKEEMDSIMPLIQISGGTPIALHAIGSRARNLWKYRKGIDSKSVWTVVCEEYKKAKNDFPKIIWNDEKNETVLNTLYLSVNMMCDGTAAVRTETLFRSFCVIKKRQQVPTHILRRLWGLSDVEANNQIEEFERFSIVEISRLSVWGQEGNFFIVHDLYLDVSNHLAKADIGFAERVSKNLIFSYVGAFNVQSEEQVTITNTPPSSSQEHAAMERRPSLAQVSFSESWIGVSDDGFVHSNLFRLLGIANMQAEGVALLRDPRWIAKLLKSSGWKQVEVDILIILRHIGSDAKRCGKTKEETFLKMLRATLIECGHLIVKSDTPGVWTQLYGRLWHYKRYEIVSEFLTDIETYATRPWYKSAGALPSPIPSVQRVFRPSRRIQMVRDSGEEVEMYGAHPKDTCISLQVYCDNVDDLKERRSWPTPDEIDITDWGSEELCCKADNLFVVGKGHTLLVYRDSNGKTEGVDNNPTVLRYDTACITCVAVNKAGTGMVAGDEDGNVRIWKCTDSVWTPTMFNGHEKKVRSVAISNGNNRIASASCDGTIRVWSFPFGQMPPSILSIDSAHVWCVSFKGENCIVSGEPCGTVTVWSLIGTNWEAAHLHGHTDAVRCVNVSESGRFLVSGSYDMTVRVWEEDNGRWKETAMMNHNSAVMRVAINENKKRVVSACLDNTVVIQELDGEHWVTEDIDGHDGWPSCYAGSNSGTRFATGADDGKIRVWDWTGHTWSSEGLDGPGGYVRDVAFNVDGQKLKANYSGGLFVFYVERDGEWTRANGEDDSKFEEGDNVEFLERQEWPDSFENIHDWARVWKLSSNYFGVFVRHRPTVSYVQQIK